MAVSNAAAAAVLSSVVLFAGGCTSAERRVIPELQNAILDLETGIATPSEAVRFLTLNTAHGRGNGVHQLLQTNRRHKQNLERIKTVLVREQPAIVALQEADGVCAWSGGFSHVRYLAKRGGFRQYVRGELVASASLSHGTALLSALPMADPLAITFAPAAASTPKGFVISTIEWPGAPSMEVDILSVHLDAFRPKLRVLQVAELIETISHRDRPMVLMGDLNTHWTGKRNVLPDLANALGLTAFEPDSDDHASLSIFGRRLDWILISDEFEFVSYTTLPDVLSDHKAVVADVALRDSVYNSSEPFVSLD